MYLLDTNVVSELRKNRPHGAVVAWMKTLTEDMYCVAAISLAEMQRGQLATRRNDPQKAAELEEWIQLVEDTFRIIAMDGPICREWARIMNQTSHTLLMDAMIAATARVHKLTIATRNTRDFESFGIEVYDPFTYR